jgi:plasmid stabilization system protein ParE
MRIDYSERALSDLAAIHDFLAREWPGVGEKFDARLSDIEHRILTFPNGAVVVEEGMSRGMLKIGERRCSP